jgi:hypothetical protein
MAGVAAMERIHASPGTSTERKRSCAIANVRWSGWGTHWKSTPYTCSSSGWIQEPSGLELENRDEVRSVDQRLVFTTFFVAETAIAGAFSEAIDSFLHRWINAKVNKTTGGSASRQRLKGSRSPSRAMVVIMPIAWHSRRKPGCSMVWEGTSAREES